MSKTVLCQAIQFSISMQFSSIWPLDRTLSGATIPGQSGPESNGNEGVLRILQSSSITGTSPSDCLVSYLGQLLVGYYLSVEKPLVYSTAPVDWARYNIWFLNLSLSFSFVHSISTSVGHLMPESVRLVGGTFSGLDLAWFGLFLWYINHWRLFNAKSSLCKYLRFIWFCLVWFYGILTLVSYLMLNPLYTYIWLKYIWSVNTFCL